MKDLDEWRKKKKNVRGANRFYIPMESWAVTITEQNVSDMKKFLFMKHKKCLKWVFVQRKTSVSIFFLPIQIFIRFWWVNLCWEAYCTRLQVFIPISGDNISFISLFLHSKLVVLHLLFKSGSCNWNLAVFNHLVSGV